MLRHAPDETSIHIHNSYPVAWSCLIRSRWDDISAYTIPNQHLAGARSSQNFERLIRNVTNLHSAETETLLDKDSTLLPAETGWTPTIAVSSALYPDWRIPYQFCVLCISMSPCVRLLRPIQTDTATLLLNARFPDRRRRICYFSIYFDPSAWNWLPVDFCDPCHRLLSTKFVIEIWLKQRECSTKFRIYVSLYNIDLYVPCDWTVPFDE